MVIICNKIQNYQCLFPIIYHFKKVRKQIEMPKTNYNQVSFWEQKYKVTSCQNYQWIQKPERVIASISKYIDYDNMDKVLEIGCGTSTFLSKVKIQAEARSKNPEFTSVDFSKQLIKKCRSGKVGLSQSNYICADVRDMKKSLNEQQFDYIFDKGCVDCLFCEDGFIKQVIKALRQCYSVLKTGGKLFIISHGKPKHRVYLFRNKLVPFQVSIEKLEEKKEMKSTRQTYVYICTKSQKNQQNNQQGQILSQGQRSDNQQPTEIDKNKENKKNQQKNQTSKNNKQNGKKQEKSDNNFILQQSTNKKKQNNKTPNDAPFILEEQKPKNKQKSKVNDGVKGVIKQKKSIDAPFILEQKQKEATFILDQNNEQKSQNEEQNKQEQKEQQEKQDNQINQQNQEQNKQKNKEAKYQDDFQQS